MTANDPSNLYVPYSQFDFYNYSRNAQGDLVYLKGANKPVKPLVPQEVDMSTFTPDPMDPGNAPFIFPEGITVADALAAQQALLTTADGNTTAAILELAKSALKSETAAAPSQILKVQSIEGYQGRGLNSSSNHIIQHRIWSCLFVIGLLWFLYHEVGRPRS